MIATVASCSRAAIYAAASHMSTLDATALLRPGLLEGVAIVLAHAAASDVTDDGCSPGAAIAATCAGLGARVFECALSFDTSHELEAATVEREAQAAAGRALADGASIELLAVDGASLFARAAAGDGAEGCRRGLRACLAGSWMVTRALATGAFLPDGRGGRIVFLAPPGCAGEYADAARAGLENLARTLSIEWARHAITTVAIAPRSGARDVALGGGADAASDVAALTAYLASPASAYFSGCLLDLRGPAGASI